MNSTISGEADRFDRRETLKRTLGRVVLCSSSPLVGERGSCENTNNLIRDITPKRK